LSTENKAQSREACKWMQPWCVGTRRCSSFKQQIVNDVFWR
jgi:hypothetical protein